MAVFYNSRSGLYVTASQSLNPLAEANFLGQEAQLHTGTGWHEYATLAQAQTAAKAHGWPAPKTGTSPGNLPSGAAAGAKSAIPGVGNIDDIISFLSQGSIWERGAEIVAGFLLLYVALKAVTSYEGVTSTAKKATKTAFMVAPK